MFLIFRYKQSHWGDNAEMNAVAECTITVPREGGRMVEVGVGGKEGERSMKRGRRQTEEVLRWVE